MRSLVEMTDIITRLAERIDALERLHYGSKTVRGFSAAARVLDLSVSTVHRRFKTDTSFPRPSRVNPNKLGRTCPEWPLSSLLNYKNKTK